MIGALSNNGAPHLESRAASRAAPTKYMRSSFITGDIIWNPTGNPSSSAKPEGNDIPPIPAMFTGIVAMSFKYIAKGSLAFSPILKAVVGHVGETKTSAFSKALVKS